MLSGNLQRPRLSSPASELTGGFEMKLIAAVLCLALPSFAAEKAKNWTPPAEKIRAQAMAEEVMAAHPELLSITFHGVPPGLDKVYTMFAGSYVDRIGNPD